MTAGLLGTHTPAAWREAGVWERENLAVTDDGLSLARDPHPTYVSPAPVFEELPADLEIVDVDGDDCGVVYVLGSDGTLYRSQTPERPLEPLSCTGAERDGTPRALCVTRDAIYVAEHLPAADGPGRGRVTAISKQLLQTRWVVTDGYTDPQGLATDGRAVYVVDAGAGDDPPDGFLARVRPDRAPDRLVDGLAAVQDVSTDGDGGVVALTSTELVRYGPDGTTERTAFADHAPPFDPFEPTCLAAVSPEDVLLGVAGDAVGPRLLYRFQQTGSGWAFDRLPTLQQGCDRLRLERGHGLYAVLDPSRDLVFLPEQHLFSRNSTSGEFDGQAWRRFDGGEVGTEWHRAVLDFSLDGPETQVRLSYVATDDESASPAAGTVGWRPLGRPNPPEAFLEDAVGRYLWIRVELVGNERASPVVSTAQVHFPRDSDLRYLPAYYREDEDSAAFLERFLSVFESVYTGVEADIESVTRFTDPYGVPGEYLAWLGEWLAVTAGERWSEAATREFVRRAASIYKQRGTRAGLLTVLGLYFETDEQLRAIRRDAAETRASEAPDGESDGGASDGDAADLDAAEDAPFVDEVPDLTDIAFLLTDADLACINDPDVLSDYRTLVSCPQCFLVLLAPDVDEADVRAVERIVEAGTPAHAVGRTVHLRPWLQVGGHSYLGVNSRLTDQEFVLDRANVGADARLVEREPYGQLGLRSQLDDESTMS